MADCNNIPVSDRRFRVPVTLPWDIRREPRGLEVVAEILQEIARLRDWMAAHGDLGEIHQRESALLMEARIEVALLRLPPAPSPTDYADSLPRQVRVRRNSILGASPDAPAHSSRPRG